MKQNTIFRLLGTWLLLSPMAILFGCPAQLTQLQGLASPTGPEEKVYRLTVGQAFQVPIEENEALVYRFDAHIPQDGLYQFETRGAVDTLCALVHGSGSKERFIIVRDTGGQGENCRLVWAFPPGDHRFKVRVDGRGHYQVILHKIPWGKSVTRNLPRDKTIHDTLEQITERHRYAFTLPAPRLIQLRAVGKGPLQCILRKPNGDWLTAPDFRQPYGACTLGKWLPAGRYLFELRTNRKDTPYRLLFQQIRMQELASDQIREGFLQGKTFDVYRVHLKTKRHHLLRTFGTLRLQCTLEDRLGHVVVPHRTAQDGKNCIISGQFPPGTYYLRIRLRHPQSGLYQVSLQQPRFTLLSGQIDKQITPDFQSPMQLYRLQIPTTRLYQIEASGRPLHCSLHSANGKEIPLMNLSEPKRCLLFANFPAGGYFLKIIPTTRDETPYRLRVVQYQSPKGEQLEDQHPRLLGPVYPGFQRIFKVEAKRPELVTLETRGALDTVCSLYDASGGKIAQNDDSGVRLNCQITRYLKPGTYRFKVRVSGRKSGLFSVQRRRKQLPWLRPGQPIQGQLHGKKRPQTYMLRVDKTGLYGIRTQSQLDTICKILDNDWQKIAQDDDSGEGKNCFLTRLLTPGVYAIQVLLYRQQKGPFQLFVDQLKLRQMKLGVPLQSTLAPPHWTVFYRLQVTQPGIYLLRTLGQLDTKCILLNEQSKQLSKNDDANGRDKNCMLLENLQRGSYFFQVTLYKDARRRGQGPFVYRALFAQKKAPLRKLPVGRYLSGTLKPAEITRYVFHIKTSGNYRIETQSQLDPKCALLNNHSQSLITQDDDSGAGRNCRIQWRLLPGTYEVQVRPATTTRNQGTYKIGVFKQSN